MSVQWRTDAGLTLGQHDDQTIRPSTAVRHHRVLGGLWAEHSVELLWHGDGKNRVGNRLGNELPEVVLGRSQFGEPCEPGVGPPLHAHLLTHEIFFVAKGRFRVEWGDDAEHCVELDLFDTLCIPPGCHRRFENVSDEKGFLFAIATGHEKVIQDAASAPSVREEILASAPAVIEGVATEEWLDRVGFRYNAGIDDGQL